MVYCSIGIARRFGRCERQVRRGDSLNSRKLSLLCCLKKFEDGDVINQPSLQTFELDLYNERSLVQLD